MSQLFPDQQVPSPLRAVAVQTFELAADELRMLTRSRRGRAAAILYGLVSLLPLGLYLWVRNRYVVPWPVDGSEEAAYLHMGRLVDAAFIVALGHDLLTRGDREGFQDGFAALPVGEATSLLGRALGRFLWLAAAMTALWLAGFCIASLWAGRFLDPVPYAGSLLSGPLLSLALLFPLAVLAGCVGNSLLGAAVVLLVLVVSADSMVAASSSRTGILDWSFTEMLFGGSGRTLDWTQRLLHALFSQDWLRGEALPGWLFAFEPDAGRGWSPGRGSMREIWTLRIALLHWAFFLAAAPYMVRLRRRAGRWKPRVPGVPTFTRWLSELVDVVRPTAPEGVTARALSLFGIIAIGAGIAWCAAAAVTQWGDERALMSPSAGGGSSRSWPVRFTPEERALDLALDDRGILRGREVLKGTVVGNPGRSLPFAFSMGLKIDEIVDGSGRPLAWQRDLDRVFIIPRREGPVEISFRFSGRVRKRRLHQYSHGLLRSFDEAGQWWIAQPMLEPFAASGSRRWLLDLQGAFWAPEPLTDASGEATRLPCFGPTTLDLKLPSRLAPVPLPGAWEERREREWTHARWKGTCAFLPPIVAGAYRRASTVGSPRVTAAVVSAGTDLEGILDRWTEAWATLPALPEAGDCVLFSAPAPDHAWWRLHRLNPDLSVPPGFVFCSQSALERRTMGVGAREEYELSSEMTLARALFRFHAIAPRLEQPCPQPLSSFLWRLAVGLEESRRAPSLAMDSSAATSFRGMDLYGAPDERLGYRQEYFEKLQVVVAAVLRTLGPDAVEAGLRKLGASGDPVTMEAAWRALAGDRADELRWFRDEVVFGRGVAWPRLDGVTLEQTGQGFRVGIAVFNAGDAYTEVPLRILGPDGLRSATARVRPGERVVVFEDLASPPDQVLLDPDYSVVRVDIPRNSEGSRWTRKGGVQ